MNFLKSVRRAQKPAAVVTVLAVVTLTWMVVVPRSASAVERSHASAVSAAAASGGPGYWLVGSDGSIAQFGTTNFGGMAGQHLNRPIVGGAPLPSGGGYWLVATDGGIFSFGAARFYGSTGSIRLNQPIVGMASTPDGGGYWLVAADGGIFAYGNARFYGSTGSIRLNRPVVGMASTPDGRGYWLVASDGGIFAFGDARFYGSTGSIRLNRPVVGMAASPSGHGYWFVAADGGIFAYGDARFYGSTGSIRLRQPVVGMAATADGNGYWFVASDGGIFAFGDAPFEGSAATSSGAPVVAIMAVAHGGAYPASTTGYDVSWPQFPNRPNCSGANLPPSGSPVAIVGVNYGSIDQLNPCYSEEAAWAGANVTVYINVNGVPDGAPAVAMHGPAGNCGATDLVCQGYNWGFNYAEADVAYVHSKGSDPGVWWLDVESPCGFSNPLWRCGTDGQSSNARVIQGAIDALHANGLVAGIYSTYLQWPGTVGSWTLPGIPIWIATVPSSTAQWAADCTNPSLRFAAGTPWLVQWLGGFSPTGWDQDIACAV